MVDWPWTLGLLSQYCVSVVFIDRYPISIDGLPFVISLLSLVGNLR